MNYKESKSKQHRFFNKSATYCHTFEIFFFFFMFKRIVCFVLFLQNKNLFYFIVEVWDFGNIFIKIVSYVVCSFFQFK